MWRNDRIMNVAGPTSTHLEHVWITFTVGSHQTRKLVELNSILANY
jgi:hypothetical protein